MKTSLAALVLAALSLVAGCANPYCGARGEPCCGDAVDRCAPGLTCRSGVCDSCDEEGELCCTDGACEGPYVCSQGLVERRCYVPCVLGVVDCPPDRNCIWTPSDLGLCAPIGVLPIDVRCTYIGDCQAGLMCSTHPGEGGLFFCEPPCTSSAECLPEHVCAPIAVGDSRATCL